MTWVWFCWNWSCCIIFAPDWAENGSLKGCRTRTDSPKLKQKKNWGAKHKILFRLAKTEVQCWHIKAGLKTRPAFKRSQLVHHSAERKVVLCPPMVVTWHAPLVNVSYKNCNVALNIDVQHCPFQAWLVYTLFHKALNINFSELFLSRLAWFTHCIVRLRINESTL